MEIKFTKKAPDFDRVHHLKEVDVRVLLSRLPEATYERLEAVHFNNHNWVRFLGYVSTVGRTEIAICSQPPRTSFKIYNCLYEFGALPNVQWPQLATRRYMLYNVFLHELGHLQIVRPKEKKPTRKFADEKEAQKFANFWRKKLYAEPFDHPDPVHNAPSRAEMKRVKAVWPTAHGHFKKGQRLESLGKLPQALELYQKALALWPEHAFAEQRVQQLKLSERIV